MKCKGASAFFFKHIYVVWIWLGGESFTTMMNFCTFKNISVFRVFAKSVESNNNKSVFKLIGKLMVWIYLSLVALWRGQCSRKWAVVSVAPHWQNGEFTMFLRNKWWLRELHCIRNPSSLAKSYDSGPPSLHPWRI